MRLCFGVLGKILRACKLETVTDPMLIGTLTRTVDPTCQYAESEGSSISRLLSCGQNLSNGQERRVGRSGNDLGYQTNRLSNVVSAAQTANVSVVARKVQDDFLQLIDEDKKRYIVPAIRDVIDQDDSLDVEKHMNFMKFFGVPKAEFLSVHVYELPRVIAQTLLFCCVAVKNSTGKESSKQITSEYVTKFSEPETYKVVFNLVQASEAKTVDTKKTDSYMQLSLVDEEPVSSYLLKLEDKYRTAKTLLYKHEPVPLYSFYVCNNIIEKVPVQSKATTTMSYSIKVIENATAKKIEECSRFVIIAGTGGLGKSMMLQHLLLNAISNYSESGIMPVFVQVRDYQGTSGDIFEYLYSKVSHFGTGFTPEAFKTMLNNGRVLFLLDGLDEIGVSNETLFEKGLSDFIDRYPFNYYVISSRPHRSFVSYSRFTVLQLQPFTKAQSLDLVDKLVYRPEIKTKFREELDEHLYRDHMDFANNPLLLTIMLMTFDRCYAVPKKMHIFYKEAFDTLAKDHDAAKPYSRPLKTGLSIDRFEMYFAEFCSRSYHDEKFEFTESEVTNYFNSLLERKKDTIPATAADFIYDAQSNLCLMFYEAGKYFFSHRSFQEYFCAFYFSKQLDKNLGMIGDFFEKRRSRNYGDKTFNMLYDMISPNVEEYIFCPFMEKLMAECSQGDGYWTFLENIYPTITYEKGETNELIEMVPNSYLYEFMKSIFFPGNCDTTNFPSVESLLVATYCYVDEGGSTQLVEKSDVRYEYILEYGDPEEVGWVYEGDIHDILKRRSEYQELLEMLNDDSYDLKREYYAAQEYLRKLKEAQKPRGDGLFDHFT